MVFPSVLDCKHEGYLCIVFDGAFASKMRVGMKRTRKRQRESDEQNNKIKKQLCTLPTLCKKKNTRDTVRG